MDNALSKINIMRIFIIQTYYPSFLKGFYLKHPEVLKKPYAEHLHAIMNEQFGTADFYSKNLALLGHIAQEFVVNNEDLQKQWARENNITYSRGSFTSIPKLRHLFKSNWKEKILLAQIKHFKPDVVYSHNLSILSVGTLKKIKKECRLLVGQIACPLPDSKYLEQYDLILSSFPHFVKKFHSMGIASEYFNLGFEESILSTLQKEPKQYNVAFIGSFDNKHAATIELLEYTCRKTPVDFWGPGITMLSEGSPIRKNYHGEVYGTAMYRTLARTKIAINRHIDIAENYANNMRLYEATGVGTMLITDAKDNLETLFKPGVEIETYRTKEELTEKIEYYLSHDDEREKIARAGQARTLTDHTYKKRMADLAAILSNYLT